MADPYWSNVVFLAGYEGTSPTDEGPLAQTVTTYGTTANSATTAKAGTKSLSIGSTSTEGISVPHNAAFNIGTQPFTIETFMYVTGNPATVQVALLADYDYSTTGQAWELLFAYGSTSLQFLSQSVADGSGSGINISASSVGIADNTWAHVAVDFDGTKCRMYVNGTMVASTTTVYPIATSDSPLFIGCEGDGTALPAYPAQYIYLDETRVTVGVARYASDAGFTVPTVPLPRTGGPANVTVSENLLMQAELVQGAVGILTEAILTAGSSTSIRTRSAQLADAVRLVGEALRARGFQDSLAEALLMTSSALALSAPQVIERVRLAVIETANAISNVQASDTASFIDALRSAQPASVSDAMTLSLAQSILSVVQIADRIGVTDMLAGSAKYNMSWADRINILERFARFVGAEVNDQLALSTALGLLSHAYGVLSEQVAVSDPVAPQLLISVAAEDALTLGDAELLQAIYTGTIIEGLELFGGELDPGGGITTWVANTRTGAVTEYTNYAFNSFARFGNKYVGAASDGLYELAGDTDEGAAVVATLKGAFLQFGGTRLSRLKDAYIAMTGDAGKFVLKLETLDGDTYVYRADTRSGRNSKVDMGKGQRARYFAYTLISEGQDFTLDTLEFVPIVVQRRV